MSGGDGKEAAVTPGVQRCDLLDGALLDFAYGELEPGPRSAFEQHLADCPQCRASLVSLGQTRRVMAALSPEPAPQEGLESLLDYARQHAQRRRAEIPRRRTWRWLGAALPVGAMLVVLLIVVSREDPASLIAPPEAPVSNAARPLMAPPAVATGSAGGSSGAPEKTAERRRIAQASEERPPAPAEGAPRPGPRATERAAPNAKLGPVPERDRVALAPPAQRAPAKAEQEKGSWAPRALDVGADEESKAFGAAGLGGMRAAELQEPSAAPVPSPRLAPRPAPVDALAPAKPSASVPSGDEAQSATTFSARPGASADSRERLGAAEKGLPAPAPEARRALESAPVGRGAGGGRAADRDENPGAAPAARSRNGASTSGADAEASSSLVDARAASARGDHAAAVTILRRLLRDEPAGALGAEARLMLAEELGRAGAPSAAADAFLRFIDRHPAHPRAPAAALARARLLEQLGRDAEAASARAELRRRWPDSGEARQSGSDAPGGRSLPAGTR